MRVNFIYEPKIDSVKELQESWETKMESWIFCESLNEVCHGKLDRIDLFDKNIHVEFDK
jgi:hypothetical protein